MANLALYSFNVSKTFVNACLVESWWVPQAALIHRGEEQWGALCSCRLQLCGMGAASGGRSRLGEHRARPGTSETLTCTGALGSDWAESRVCNFSAGHIRDVDVLILQTQHSKRHKLVWAVYFQEECGSCSQWMCDRQAGREVCLNRRSQRVANSSLLLSECFPHLSSKQRRLQNF